MRTDRIYQPCKNSHPKLLAVFPLGIGLTLLGHGLTGQSTLITPGLLLNIIGIWTFFGRSERYVDLIERKVVTRKKWLWLTWGRKIPLSHYTHVAVVLASSGSSSGSVLGCEVNLIGKDADSGNL